MARAIRRCGLAAVVLALAIGAARADEGMWRLEQLELLPLEELHERGLGVRPPGIRSLARAVVRIGSGGTGAFVSPEGLILTNHHVAHRCITANSTPERNLYELGFVAHRREDELPCRGYEVLQLVDTRDVTAEVHRPEDGGLSPHELWRTERARRSRLATTCQQGRQERRCEVSSLFGGVRELLLTYQVLRDLRLVHAPERALGVFGGDADNFEWPRHTADYALLRAYVAPTGESQPYDPANRPHRPTHHLSVSTTGFWESGFVMVLGYPGRTERHAPAAALERRTASEWPHRLARLEAQIRILQRHAARPEQRLHVIDQLRALTNSAKAVSGQLDALGRGQPLAARHAQDREVSAWIAEDPARRARYGDPVKDSAALIAAQAQQEDLSRALEGLTTGVRSLEWAYTLYAHSVERTKPDDERRDPHHERQETALFLRTVEAPSALVPALEEDLIADAVEQALSLPANRRVTAVDQRLAGRQGAPAALARALARELVAATKLGDPDVRRRCFAMSPTELTATGDPLLAFAADLHRQRAALLDQQEREIVAPLDLALQRYEAALFACKGPAFYPDADNTLRFTHGLVQGYFPPQRGARRPYATTIGSLLATTTEHPDYRLSEELAVQLSGRTVRRFADMNLGVEVVNFVATTDIAGGNSGSPALDGAGQIIGCVFDSNYEALGGKFSYGGDHGRTIMVDIRFVLDLLLRVYGTPELVAELGVQP